MILTTERDLTSYGFDPAKPPIYLGGIDITLAGGTGKAENLARRVRRVSPDRARRLRAIQKRIAKLQADHTELIGSLWGDGEVLDVGDLVTILTRRPARRKPKPGDYSMREYNEQDARDNKARGSAIRDVKATLEPTMSITPKEAVR